MILIVLLFVSSKIFDLSWGSNTSVPIISLDEIYAPPLQYDNFTRVNLKMLGKDMVAIEGNKKFRLKDHNTGFEFYDTITVTYPNAEFERTNIIFFQFENSPVYDSIYLVISKSSDSKLFYKQVFYSSVIVSNLNEFSKDPSQFRIDPSKLVNSDLLSDNDTLINKVLDYFNANIENLGLAECGRNCQIFQKICRDFDVPCRLVNLQGGDDAQVGYYQNLGYPLHVVIEIYSSKYQKWYVIDPTFGFRFRLRTFNDYLNAVEISSKHTFRREDEIEQDSILYTKRTLVGKDYFTYYENVMFTKPEWKNKYLRKLVNVFYSNFTYYLHLYSNNFPPVKNGFYYVGIKTFMYIFILILYINAVIFLLLRRLFLVKKPNN